MTIAGSKFRINITNTIMPNKVAAIKAIRTLTGKGLKEAMDCVNTGGEHILEISTYNMLGVGDLAAEIEKQFTVLRQQGIEVGEPVHKLLEELRVFAVDALKLGEDELANEILQLVLAEKLRRK